MIGEAPQCPEFNELFDWNDAVIKVPVSPSNVRDILDELDSQPARMERVRQINAIQSLRRHDWIYRWEKMLQAIGMEPSPKVQERKQKLHQIADVAEAAFNSVAPALVTGTR